jgi:hypothetical protein
MGKHSWDRINGNSMLGFHTWDCTNGIYMMGKNKSDNLLEIGWDKIRLDKISKTDMNDLICFARVNVGRIYQLCKL